MEKMINLGTFTIESNKIVLSDPSYDDKEHTVHPVSVGTWNAFVKKGNYGNAGERCSELHAYHQSLVSDDSPKQDLVWENAPITIPVDAGQAGMFSTETFRNEDKVTTKPDFDTGDLWYDMCCDITLGEVGAGVVDGGVVSSAGFGDGVYPAEISKNEDGNIVAIKIVFITEEDK